MIVLMTVTFGLITSTTNMNNSTLPAKFLRSLMVQIKKNYISHIRLVTQLIFAMTQLIIIWHVERMNSILIPVTAVSDITVHNKNATLRSNQNLHLYITFITANRFSVIFFEINT